MESRPSSNAQSKGPQLRILALMKPERHGSLRVASHDDNDDLSPFTT